MYSDAHIKSFLRHLLTRIAGLPEMMHMFIESRVSIFLLSHHKTYFALNSVFKNSQESLVLLNILFRVTGFPEMSG